MPSFDLRCLLVVVPAVLSLAGCATPDPVAHPCPTFGVLSDAETLTAFGSGSQEPTNVMYRAMLGNASLDCRYKGLKLPRNRTPVGQPDLRISPGMGPSGEGGGYLGSELLVPKQASSSVCQSDSSDADQSSGGEGNADNADDQDQGRRRRGPTKTIHVTGDFKFDLSVAKGPALTDTKVTVPYFVAIMRNQKFVLAREEFSADFDLSGKQAAARQVVLPIDIPLARNMTGASYQVIVGLRLTPDQLAYNRQHPNP